MNGTGDQPNHAGGFLHTQNYTYNSKDTKTKSSKTEGLENMTKGAGETSIYSFE